MDDLKEWRDHDRAAKLDVEATLSAGRGKIRLGEPRLLRAIPSVWQPF